MSAVSAYVAAHKIAAALLGGLVIAGVGTVAIAAPARAPVAVVTGVLDGDTISVTVDGEPRRVQLLNVAAPAVAGENVVATCLGEEAAAFLAERLPVGTPVRLRYGSVRQDELGRDLAGVYVDGALLNAELAAAGLAMAERTDGDNRFLDQMAAAEAQARRAEIGLHDAAIPCTLPAQIAQLQAEVAAVESVPLVSATPDELQAREARLAEAARVGEELTVLLSGDAERFPLSAYPTSVAAMRILVGVTSASISQEQAEVRHAITGEGPDGAGTGGADGAGPAPQGGGLGAGSQRSGESPSAVGSIQPRTGSPAAPTGGASVTGTGAPAGSANDAAAAALEAQRRAAAEDAARRAVAAEQARRAAVEEAARRAVAEEEARRAAALEAARVQDAARRAAAEDAARQALAEEAARQAAADKARREAEEAAAQAPPAEAPAGEPVPTATVTAGTGDAAPTPVATESVDGAGGEATAAAPQ